jgi:hypothetical protein
MQFCCNEELMLLFKLLCSLEKEFVIIGHLKGYTNVTAC